MSIQEIIVRSSQLLINSIEGEKKEGMDYDRLYSQIPKQPIKWTVADIEVWLRFIGLENLYPKFKQLAIDGSILSSLTEEDLREELGVKSGITIKKVMSWIKKGLQQYEQFLRSANAGLMQNNDLRQITQKPKNSSLLLSQNITTFNNNPGSSKAIGNSIPTTNNIYTLNNVHSNPPMMMVEQPPIVLQQPSYRSVGEEHHALYMQRDKYSEGPGGSQNHFPNTKEPLPEAILAVDQEMDMASQMIDEDDGEKKKQYELIIQQYDGPQTSFFSVKEQGAKIGRHSSNQILILDQSISRFHAEIQFQDQKFFLRDTGSTTGTFIKVTARCQILPQMIFEMGSNQFQSHFKNGSLLFEIIEGPSQGLQIQIPKHRVSIGRKQNNELYFPDDQHLSNMHSTISPIEGKYFLEDMGTTNGTWRRLSLEAESSTSFQLTDKVVFKIGSSQTYCCKIKTAYVSEKTNPNACIICYENDKDCVYMPCKHNTACIKCSKNLKQCPICRYKIEDFIRIYKS